MNDKKTELIVQDGKIYHLDLRPAEIAEKLILVGDPGRVSEVSKHFDSVEVRRTHREFITHTGVLAGERMSVVSTGIGTDNIDIVLTEWDALLNVDLKTQDIHDKLRRGNVIRLGTSGSIQEDIAPGELLLSKYAIGLDNLMQYYTTANNENDNEIHTQFRKFVDDHFPDFPLTYGTHGSDILISQFQTLGKTGITLTAPGFYGPQGRMIRAIPKFKNFLDEFALFKTEQGDCISNLEMETAGIYGMCSMLGHDCLSISAIIANRVTGEFHADPKRAVDKMITDFLSQLIKVEN